MMWNLLVSGLLVGSTIVLYGGNPSFGGPERLWQLAERHRVTYFGTSAAFLDYCQEQKLTPGTDHDLSSCRAVRSTGSPLTPEGFRWIIDTAASELLCFLVPANPDSADELAARLRTQMHS